MKKYLFLLGIIAIVASCQKPQEKVIRITVTSALDASLKKKIVSLEKELASEKSKGWRLESDMEDMQSDLQASRDSIVHFKATIPLSKRKLIDAYIQLSEHIQMQNYPRTVYVGEPPSAPYGYYSERGHDPWERRRDPRHEW